MLYAYNNLGVSASSITTRIKTTEDMSAVLSTAVSASASSITTRIKTENLGLFCRSFPWCECIIHYNKD